MSPVSTPRHLLVSLALPTIVALFGLFWYKRKKSLSSSNPKGIDPTTSTRILETVSEDHSEVKPSPSMVVDQPVTTPSKPVTFSRSLSGVESTPIDIKTGRSAPLVISDTELDLEIEKIKSMKNGTSSIKKNLSSKMTTSPSKRRTPKKSATPINVVNNTSVTSTSSNSSAGSNVTTPTVEEELRNHHRGRSVERDSANHSPADAMLPASPSLSSISDNQSDSDSGKGGSDVATPPPAVQQSQQGEEASSLPDTTTSDIGDTHVTLYEFVIPQILVGRLIGKHGAFVHTIRDKTNAKILIKKHPDNQSSLKICSIEGTTSEIDSALNMIRDKFPLKRFPDLTLEQVSFVPIVPDCMHLRLIEGVNNDTIVSCIQTPVHLFLQQPTHPTFPSLHMLSDYMFICYDESATCGNQPPLLPTPILPGTICAAQSDCGWYRVSVITSDDTSNTACIKFLDVGGFATVPHSQLRQIRGDFLLTPFQAAECMLANVEPVDADAGWCQESYEIVYELTRGAIVFTQVVDYLDDGVTPLVHIYIRSAADPRGVELLNQILVDRGFAKWIDDDDNDDDTVEVAVETR